MEETFEIEKIIIPIPGIIVQILLATITLIILTRQGLRAAFILNILYLAFHLYVEFFKEVTIGPIRISIPDERNNIII